MQVNNDDDNLDIHRFYYNSWNFVSKYFKKL